MTFNLKLISVENANDILDDPKIKRHLNAFTKQANSYFKLIYLEAIKDLTEKEKEVFDLWWHGGKVNWKEVEKDHKTHSAILWSCSQGCG